MSENEALKIQKLLQVVVALLVRKEIESTSLKDQVATLSNLGLSPKDISEILGKTNTHINKELAVIRKGRKKGK